jgi:hypothetical protein
MPIDLGKLTDRQRMTIEGLDPEARRALELLAEAQAAGFTFYRLAPNDPVVFGTRETALWRDTIRLDGVGYGCSAQHMRLNPVSAVTGPAVEVMNAVLHWT